MIRNAVVGMKRVKGESSVSHYSRLKTTIWRSFADMLSVDKTAEKVKIQCAWIESVFDIRDLE